MTSRRSPASTTSPTRSSRCGTRDEAKRFLRDLCTLGELEALAHRWQIVRLLDEGRAVPRDRRARAHQHGDRHARGAVAAPRRRRLPARARRRTPARRHGVSAGVEGRLLVAVPSKGRMAPPALELLAAAGLRFEAGERALHVPCAERPGRPAARPAARHPRVRPGRRRPRRDHRREPRRRGAAPTSSSSPSSASPAARWRRRCRTAAPQQALADLDGLRVATAYPVSTRAALARARGRGRARPDLRLGRGGAAARPLRRDRRPRLDRLDGERRTACAGSARCSRRRRS